MKTITLDIPPNSIMESIYRQANDMAYEHFDGSLEPSSMTGTLSSIRAAIDPLLEADDRVTAYEWGDDYLTVEGDDWVDVCTITPA